MDKARPLPLRAQDKPLSSVYEYEEVQRRYPKKMKERKNEFLKGVETGPKDFFIHMN